MKFITVQTFNKQTSSQQLQMASVLLEHNSLFKPLMWNDSIDTSYWRKPLVEGNYVQHLSLLVEFFHFIYSSFIFYVRRKKQSQIKHIYRTKRQGSHQCTGMGRFGSHLLWKAPCIFPYTGLTVDACVSHLTCSFHDFLDISVELFLSQFLSFFKKEGKFRNKCECSYLLALDMEW